MTDWTRTGFDTDRWTIEVAADHDMGAAILSGVIPARAAFEAMDADFAFDEWEVYEVDTWNEGCSWARLVPLPGADPLPDWVTEQCIHRPRCTVERDCDALLREQGDGSW